MFTIEIIISDWDSVISKEIFKCDTFKGVKKIVKDWLSDYEIEHLVNIAEEPDCKIPKVSGSIKKGTKNYSVEIKVTEE